MGIAYRRCAAIDVHKKSLSVCIRPPIGRPNEPLKEQTFRTFTKDLRRLRKWLIQCRVTELAMESTGQYWRPVWNVLEGAVAKMLLLNPAHVKGLAGHKTDRKDAQWLAVRLEREDLKGSFVPAQPLREMRELTRLRVHWLQDLNRIKNRIGDICEGGNIKISSVASDLFGQSGRKMLDAIVAGNRDAGWMADYAKGTLRGKRGLLELALEGSFTPHQRKLLGRSLRQMKSLEAEISDLTEEIAQKAAAMGWTDAIRRLDTIPGIDVVAALAVLAETGLDMGVFGDAEHLASWAAVCPGQRESGGKRLSGRTRKGNVYLRRVLCQCAWAATNTNDCFLASFYRRVRSRKGHQKAIMAVAHRLLVIVFHMLQKGTEYREVGGDFHAHRNAEKTAMRHVAGLQKLGYYVTLQKAALAETVVACGPEAPALSSAGDSLPLVADPLPPVAEQEAGRRRPGRPCKCAERGIRCTHRNNSAADSGKQKVEKTQTHENTRVGADCFS